MYSQEDLNRIHRVSFDKKSMDKSMLAGGRLPSNITNVEARFYGAWMTKHHHAPSLWVCHFTFDINPEIKGAQRDMLEAHMRHRLWHVGSHKTMEHVRSGLNELVYFDVPEHVNTDNPMSEVLLTHIFEVQGWGSYRESEAFQYLDILREIYEEES